MSIQPTRSSDFDCNRYKKSCLVAVLLIISVVVASLQNERPAWFSTEWLRYSTAGTTATVTIKDFPALRENLCLANVPNTSFGPALFGLARNYLGVNATEVQAMKERPSQIDLLKQRPRLEITSRFYAGAFSNSSEFRTVNNGTIVYVPIWKAANNEIRTWMNDTFEGIERGDLAREKLKNIAKNSGSQDLCILTAIRDPISHFLSGYNEIECRRNSVIRQKALEDIEAPTYFGMPFSSNNERKERFQEFVYDLLLEDSLGWSAPDYPHVFSMSRVLAHLHRFGLELTAYLPSLENLATSFPRFVREECTDILAPYNDTIPSFQVNQSEHLSSQDVEGFYQAAKDVWAEGGKVAKALCAIHAMDYSCWKDLPTGIPELCAEVYSSSEFLDAIMK